MKAKRLVPWVKRVKTAGALGICLAAQAALGAPTQWTALYNRGQPLATYVVGDVLDYQFEFAINMDTTGWGVEYGLGQTQDGSDWSWYGADWSRMDGDDNRVWISRPFEHRFTSAGTWYYAGRFMAGDTYPVATDWTANSGEPLAAESYFMVNELEPPSAMATPSATYPATRADLTWSSWEGKNVLITMTTDWQGPTDAPEQGRAYAAGETFGNQTVVSGSQGGSSLEVAGLMPNADYVFTFYTENNSYYSSGTSSHIVTLMPQARNTDGGAPEAPAEVFLGDAGLTFGCDTWGTLDENWGRMRMWMESPDWWGSSETDWTEYTDAEHKTVQSGVFTCTGIWNYGFQVDYGSPYGENFWFGIESSDWTDLIPAPIALMTVTVQPIVDPVDVRAEFYSGWDGNAREVILDWSANNRGDGVMIVRKRAEDAWTEPTQGQFYDAHYEASIGAGTVIKSAWDPAPFGDQDDLEAGASYDYKFYSVNLSSMDMMQWPEAGAYYSPGVEVRVDIPLPPVIVTETLPEGEEMEPYFFVLEATSEYPLEGWTAAGLPDGLSCSYYGEVSGIPTQAGTYSVTFTVRDFYAGTTEKTFDLVIQPNPNLRPVIESTAPAAGAVSLNEGTDQLFTVLAQDPEGSNLVYTWTWDGSVVGSNDFRYERSAAWGDSGTHSLRCTVSDGLWTQTVYAEWSVTIVDLPFEITTLSLPSGRVGEAYEANLAATNGVSPYGWFALEPTNVAAWGDASYGRCAVPLSLTNAVAVDAGGEHSLALKSDGTVAVWGRNIYGQTNIPAGLGSVVAISAGADHNLALKSDGTVVAWGRNSSGQTNVPIGLSNVVAVAGGSTHSLALISNGTVVAWGNNSYGQTNVPADLTNAIAIAGLNFHSLALKADGTVVGWGRNNYGQTNVPAGLRDVGAIAAGVEHSLALKSDGTVVGWGRNNYGQTNVPAGLSNVVAIAAGTDHSMALKSDGTLVAWGRNNYGQTNVPVGLSNVVVISSGWSHNLAIFSQTAPRQMPDGLTCSENGVVSGTPTQVGTNLVTFIVRDSVGTTTNKELEIVVQAAPPAPLLSQTSVNVRESGEGRFFVRLDRAPEGSVTVSVERDSGDEGISIQGGATRTFKTSNWSTWQTVTLAAPGDANAVGETATFRISTPGAADQFVTATALDDDVGENLALASGGVTIRGATALAIDGIHDVSTNYVSTKWTSVPPGTFTMDLQNAATVSRIRLLNWDWGYRTHQYRIQSSLNGTTWTTLVDASTGEHAGWEDWAVANQTMRFLRFTGLSNSANSSVCIAELEVYGAGEPLPQLELSAPTVNVREEGEGRFFVRLDGQPVANVNVSVDKISGAENLGLQGPAVLTFKPSNWDVWQPVALAAGADEDGDSETAVFRVSAPGAADLTVDAATLDDDIGENLALASGGTTIRGATALAIDGIHTVSTNYVSTKWTSVPPGTMTMDLQTVRTVSRIRLLNWDWGYRVHRYRIQASADGKSWTTVADASTGEYSGWNDWTVADQAIRYLRFTGLSNSANSSVCIAEWEVYGPPPVRRSRLSAAPAAGFAVAESEPISVLTSDGAADETGWNAVDGDEETAWVGPKAGGGYVVVEYQPELELSALEVVLAAGSPTNIQYLYSADAQDWQPLPDDLDSNPIALNYLWIVFPDDGTATVPQVLEIVPNP